MHTHAALWQVRARFVERFSMGAPFSGGEVRGPAFNDVSEKVSWVEKFVRLGTAAASQAAADEDDWCVVRVTPYMRVRMRWK